MNVSQFEALVATCEYASYTRAADVLFVSQPALHHKVKQLEAEFGVPLVQVRDRRVVPTVQGRLVLSAASRILSDLDGLKRELACSVERRSVRITSTSVLGDTILPRLVEASSVVSPQLTIEVVEYSSGTLEDLFAEDLVDLALCADGEANGTWVTEPVLRTRVVCAVNPGHPLAVNEGPVAPEQLEEFARAVPGTSDRLRQNVDQWWKDNLGTELADRAYVTGSWAAAAQAAAVSRHFITFLPSPAVRAYRLTELPTTAEDLTASASVCYPPNRRRRSRVDAVLGALRAVSAVPAG